ncbi:MAG TPA: glycoside hydrolase family 31 protein [Chloroflexi bacterium]|nr:glycoside hydrolase family 31 protein [Chloroflexota bacterium]
MQSITSHPNLDEPEPIKTTNGKSLFNTQTLHRLGLDYQRVTRWRDFERSANGVHFCAETNTGTAVEITLDFVSPEIVRLRMGPEPLSPPRHHLLVQEEWPAIPFLITEAPDRLELSSWQIHVNVAREPWSLSIYNATHDIVCSEATEYPPTGPRRESMPVADLGFWRDPETGLTSVHETFRLAPDEDIYGLGERFSRINRVGQQITLWATDAYGISQHATYKNVPFLWSTQGYGLFVNTTHRVTFDVGAISLQTHGFTHEGPALDMFLIYGPEPATILRRYCDLTGYAPIPPRWSFGLWMSRCGYQDQDEVEQIATQLRMRAIPCDVIHVDPWWMGDAENWCGLQWDEDRFPSPDAMIEKLRQKGLRLCLWENPYVAADAPNFEEGKEKGYFVKDENGAPYLIDPWADEVPTVAVVDFTNPEAVDWWQSLHRPLLEQGVSVFKTDFGESAPEDGVYASGISGREAHNLYPLLYNQAVFEITEAVTDEGLVWSRAGWAGSQRYPTCWGGDPPTDFEAMARQLRGALSIGLSGIPFYSHDIGGFAGEPDPELYVRWAQFGLFSAHSRCHGTTPREPWTFGPEAEAIFLHYVRLRYQLLPYIYATAVQSSLTGLPMMRALILRYSHDPNVRHIDNEYLFGDNFLVAPVLKRGAKRRMVYLPVGEWVDFWGRETYEGPAWLNFPAPLEIMPLFIRQGAIIPMGPAIDYVDQPIKAPLAIHVFTGSGGSFTLYDEETSPVEFSYTADDTALRITIAGPLKQAPVILLNGFPSVQRVTVNHRPYHQWRVEGGGVVIELADPDISEIIVWR